jgi:hypothetical protein
MPHIFISYAREDAVAAKALADLLDSEGFEVWWDPAIRIGQEFPDEIEKAIWDSQYVIVLWSRHSVSSEWVRREAELGRKSDKLLPVQMDGCELPRGFKTLHTIRFDGWAPLLHELYRTVGGGAFAIPSHAVHSARRVPADDIPEPKPRNTKTMWLLIIGAALSLMGLGAALQLLLLR